MWALALTNEERDINREIKSVKIESGDDIKLLGELIFNDLLKDQRKYRHPINKMDFVFNRRCDMHPIGSKVDGVLLVSVVTPLNDDYELYSSGKCILESGTEGGHVLIKLHNDESLGRELRAHLQTEKYIRHKNDGTLPESTKRILHGISEDNQERRKWLVTLLGEMLAGASYYVAGQSLKLKATTPMAALDEALEYLVRNTFTKMGYLKRLNSEPLKEVQAILCSNDIGQQTLALEKEEGNQQAIDDLRSYFELCTNASKQVVLHDLIEKRYSLRPYGWPDDEVLILVARLLILGEIRLMMDGAWIPLDKAYEAITTPGKRRKIVLVKRHASDPKVLQNARSLGKELFHEMGPDGEDALFNFLQNQLKDWQSSLNRYKPLADTGDYHGKDEIADGLVLVKKLLACDGSYKFIEQFNSQKDALLGLADQLSDLEHFYEHQKPTWEKLRKAYERFQLNRMELDRDPQAGPALRRMQEILAASSPYGLIQEVDGLIGTVGMVNTALVSERRQQAIGRIEGYIAALTGEIEAAHGEAGLRSACLKPLESLLSLVHTENSLAHITHEESEALKEFDAAVLRLEGYVKEAAERSTEGGPGTEPGQPKPVIKKQRVVEPARLVQKAYLETMDEVRAFLDALRKELETAIAHNERIQIR